MKKRYLIVIIVISLLLEVFVTLNFLNKKEDYSNDTVKINELVKEIEYNYGTQSKYPKYFKYSIIDNDGNLVYKTDENVSKTMQAAYKNQDTIVDIKVNNEVKGKLVIYNELNENLEKNNKQYIAIIIAIAMVQVCAFVVYFIYMYHSVIKPFKKMKAFATRVSEGNLDIPLDMDKNNNFGAFTESFDIMRSEIKKARIKEKKAIDDKKELVAKLSHDIKTPISSIKSSSELGIELATDEKSRNYFKSINQKSDQINTLITNLFNSTLEELEELKISPIQLDSSIIEEMMINSDYLKKADIIQIDKCIVYADKVRIQQVFDNIFANSYKYANTKIEVTSKIDSAYLCISIRDFGTDFIEEELPLYTEKFKRGSNVISKDGAGLGLYISRELLDKMNGSLELENAKPGFKVLIKLRII